jgi:hypothetical protein
VFESIPNRSNAMKTSESIPPVPALAIDKYFRDAGYGPLSADQRIERQIAWALLHNLTSEFKGVELRIDDREEVTACTGDDRITQAMELIFNLDEAVIRFGNAWVLLIVGNGTDLISDYGSNDRTERAIDATTAQLDLA